ncbi:hypothetical protein [Persicitalea jodogahamensis]|uniref:hypothetical protein n=1 Tax=Persicitalea jodogahamensis TaxID=402147 RepID=UPI001677A81A|nr:hypothetical protein [Persicitalea jodogahamensis]
MDIRHLKGLELLPEQYGYFASSLDDPPLSDRYKTLARFRARGSLEINPPPCQFPGKNAPVRRVAKNLLNSIAIPKNTAYQRQRGGAISFVCRMHVDGPQTPV